MTGDEFTQDTDWWPHDTTANPDVDWSPPRKQGKLLGPDGRPIRFMVDKLPAGYQKRNPYRQRGRS